MRTVIILGAAFLCCALGRCADQDCSDAGVQPAPVGGAPADAKPGGSPTAAKTGQPSTCASDKVVLDLVVIASNSYVDLPARTRAIDQIGNSGKAALAVPALRRLLSDPPVTYVEWEDYVYHIARALGKFHPPEVCDAIPDLIAARGESIDPCVQHAIDDVLTAINVEPAAAQPPTPPTSNAPELVKTLKDKSANVTDRFNAAEALGNFKGVEAELALCGLLGAIEGDLGPELSTQAMTSARKLLKNIAKEEQFQQYASSLGKLLQASKEPKVQVMAAQEIGGLKGQMKLVPQAVLDILSTVAADKKADPDVQCAAKNALAIFTTPPPTSP